MINELYDKLRKIDATIELKERRRKTAIENNMLLEVARLNNHIDWLLRKREDVQLEIDNSHY